MTYPTQHLRILRRFACALGFATLLAAAPSPPPNLAASKAFDIPAGSAVQFLEEFATQSGIQLVYSADAVEGVETHAVRGAYSPLAALKLMLAGTGLVVSEDIRSGALAIRKPSPIDLKRLPVAVAPPPRPQAAFLPGPDMASPENEEVIKLTPFEVTTDQPNSYGVLQSNSLTAFSMDLQKMPATAEVFTQTFIKDTNSDTIEQMLVDFSGIVGYTPGDTGAYSESNGDRDGGGGLSIRGFGNGGGIKFDGFFGPPSSTRSAAGSTPTFMIERVEVVEGPQSLLYGAIGAGGVINAIYKRAAFGVQAGALEYSVNDLGGKTALVDVNSGAGPIAFRFAATSQDNATVRQNLGNTTEGYYLQGAYRLGQLLVVRVIHNKYETDATNGFNPSLKTFLPTGSPLANNSTAYLAVTNQVPTGVFGGAIDWNNINSFAGEWGSEPSTIVNDSIEIESTLRPWLSARITALYDQYQDWRNTTSLALAPVGGTDPYSVPAIQVANPNLNFQSQRQRAVQLNIVATGDFLHGIAHSQTILGGYLNHIGPSYGSSGITYSYVQADSSWNPVIGTGTADYGHILMPNQFIPIIGGQITRYPLFHPGQSRVTLGGVNYILEPRIVQSAAYKGFPIPGSPTNPYGLVPNGGNNLTNTAPGGNFTFNGTFNPGTEEHETYLTLGNYTDWFGGRLSTLVGVSIDKANSANFGATADSFLPWTRYNGFEVSAIYQLTAFLGIYADLGTAATPAGSTNNLFGEPLAAPSAKGVPEFGLKMHTADERFGAQLAWDIETQDHDEIQSTDSSYLNAINPNGINGRSGGTAVNNFVNIDRTATALELTATASPTPDWRIRFNMSYLFARVSNNVEYPQLYNDQFHTNSAGQVTYSNGTVVLVDGTAANGPAIVAPGSTGAVPLTTAMISSASSPYWVQPDPTSGTITNVAMKSLLGTAGVAGSVQAAEVGANGPVATGVTGLPISQNQVGFVSAFANGIVPVFVAGNPTTGYPGWQWNLETDYTIAHGPLKGFGAFFDASVQYSIRGFYAFYPNSQNASLGTEASNPVNEARILYVLPTQANCGVGLHYTHSLGRSWFTTKIVVKDLFNHDRFDLQPQAGNGTFLQATQRISPRLWSWVNEIDY